MCHRIGWGRTVWFRKENNNTAITRIFWQLNWANYMECVSDRNRYQHMMIRGLTNGSRMCKKRNLYFRNVILLFSFHFDSLSFCTIYFFFFCRYSCGGPYHIRWLLLLCKMWHWEVKISIRMEYTWSGIENRANGTSKARTPAMLKHIDIWFAIYLIEKCVFYLLLLSSGIATRGCATTRRMATTTATMATMMSRDIFNWATLRMRHVPILPRPGEWERELIREVCFYMQRYCFTIEQKSPFVCIMGDCNTQTYIWIKCTGAIGFVCVRARACLHIWTMFPDGLNKRYSKILTKIQTFTL